MGKRMDVRTNHQLEIITIERNNTTAAITEMFYVTLNLWRERMEVRTDHQLQII